MGKDLGGDLGQSSPCDPLARLFYLARLFERSEVG